MGLLNSNSLNEWLTGIPERAREAYRGLLNTPSEVKQLFDPQFQQGLLKNATPVSREDIINQGLNISGMAPYGMAGHIVYHGSPHKFNKFDMSKIGTGEGAQAYGHGLYMAEAPGVAKQYADTLSSYHIATKDGVKGGGDFADALVANAGEYPSSLSSAIRSQANKIATDLANGKPAEQIVSAMRNGPYARIYSGLADAVENLSPSKAVGSLYKVDIPDEAVARMLDWDKPLSQQAPEVQAALKRRITDVKPVDGFDMGGNARLRDNSNGQIDPDSFHPWILEATGANGTSKFGLTQKDVDRMFGTKDVMDLTGEQIISRLAAERGGQGAASDYLKSINVPGIRYLDQGSRTAGEGTYNYVLFDDQLPRILEINGQPTGLLSWADEAKKVKKKK